MAEQVHEISECIGRCLDIDWKKIVKYDDEDQKIRKHDPLLTLNFQL